MTTAHASAYEPAHEEAQPGATHVHVMPPRILLAVYFALVVLTVVTVAVAYQDLGPLNVWVALLIAVVKASLVVLFFMHLKYDRPFNALVIIIALMFVAVFIATTIMDSGEYKVNYQPPGTRLMMTSQSQNAG